MPLSTRIVGQTTRTFEHPVDARWTMAYAAGLGDSSACYMDTQARPDVIAHPVFPVCVEWPVILDARNIEGNQSVTAEEASRGVHASHDLHIYQPIRAGDTLKTVATIIGVEKIKPGAAQWLRLDSYNQREELVTRTFQQSISRGVDIMGSRNFCAEPPAWPAHDARKVTRRIDIPVLSGAANVYTETARIFNPIHSDRLVALNAGLPDIILHGTATLALAVSKITEVYSPEHPEKLIRLGGRFSAMVLMPSTLTLLIHNETDTGLSYSVLTESGQYAISNGFISWQT